MPTRASYDYAYLRVVPRVQMGEFRNVGVILYCRTQRYLEVRLIYDPAQLADFVTPLNAHAVEEQLRIVAAIARGGGPIGALGQAEAFHWLVAPHSTVIQASDVHSGLCDDPAAALDALAGEIVRAKSHLTPGPSPCGEGSTA